MLVLSHTRERGGPQEDRCHDGLTARRWMVSCDGFSGERDSCSEADDGLFQVSSFSVLHCIRPGLLLLCT